MHEIFLDTAYAIALSAQSDQYHAQALLLAEQLEESNARLITTHAVMLEIGNALARQRHRAMAVRLLFALEIDPNVEILPLSRQLYEQALQVYRARPDKEWGLTDCVSYLVMQERGITEVLTSDMHFQQMGFRALLLELPA
jgi:predicted nucleic acid-binding protein